MGIACPFVSSAGMDRGDRSQEKVVVALVFFLQR